MEQAGTTSYKDYWIKHYDFDFEKVLKSISKSHRLKIALHTLDDKRSMESVLHSYLQPILERSGSLCSKRQTVVFWLFTYMLDYCKPKYSPFAKTRNHLFLAPACQISLYRVIKRLTITFEVNVFQHYVIDAYQESYEHFTELVA
jgi:hypothetical protein